jgi:hypothetical protein
MDPRVEPGVTPVRSACAEPQIDPEHDHLHVLANVEREGRLWGEFEAGENRLAPAEAQVVALMNIDQPSCIKISAPTPTTHPLGVGRAVAERIAFSGSRTSTLPRTHAPPPVA